MYAIALHDGEDIYYWTTTVNTTHNYTSEPNDATLFSDRVGAACLMRTLGLEKDEHEIVEVRKENR